MSTTYCLPKPPVTGLRLVTEGLHDKLSVFVDHKLSGILVTDRDSGGELAALFIGEPLIHSHYGGKGVGRQLSAASGVPLSAIAPGTTVIDEDTGQPWTVGDLLARQRSAAQADLNRGVSEGAKHVDGAAPEDEEVPSFGPWYKNARAIAASEFSLRGVPRDAYREQWAMGLTPYHAVQQLHARRKESSG